MPVCLCLCTFIEIRKGTKNLDFVMCTVVYIGLGKTPVTIWTIGSLENWGNHWRKWTILRSFRATLVTLPDCIGGVTWQHISLDGYRCLPDQFCFTLFNKTRSVMGIINSSPNLSLLSRALALTAITTNLNKVYCPWVWSSLILLQCLIPSLPG